MLLNTKLLIQSFALLKNWSQAAAHRDANVFFSLRFVGINIL